jgi:hypothetical protein
MGCLISRFPHQISVSIYHFAKHAKYPATAQWASVQSNTRKLARLLAQNTTHASTQYKDTRARAHIHTQQTDMMMDDVHYNSDGRA